MTDKTHAEILFPDLPTGKEPSPATNEDDLEGTTLLTGSKDDEPPRVDDDDDNPSPRSDKTRADALYPEASIQEQDTKEAREKLPFGLDKLVPEGYSHTEMDYRDTVSFNQTLFELDIPVKDGRDMLGFYGAVDTTNPEDVRSAENQFRAEAREHGYSKTQIDRLVHLAKRHAGLQ